jgi:hypothetical protein
MMTTVLVDGDASGQLLVLREPLSFWGGVDAGSGRIIDQSHHAVGESVTGKILFMPHGRGSSSSASVIAESIRNGVGPVGFILAEPDDIVVTGVFVANRLYGTSVPVMITNLPKSPGRTVHLSARGARNVEGE